ncbi:MAG: hypothetical protein WD766_00560 [Gemmatimonadota bacterium]
MTRDMERPRAAWKPVLLLGFGMLLALLVWMDRGSVERGNRLFRSGQGPAAQKVYRGAAEGRGGAAGYNLGTALLADGLPDAEVELERSAASADSTVAQRASYNLGYAKLIRVTPGMPPDSAIPLLTDAVRSSRTALRLNPRDEDARWNVALGQRMLDSLSFNQRLIDREEIAGEDDFRLQDQALTRSDSGDGISGLEPEDPRPADNIGQRTGSATGAREAWASQDPGPMSVAAAQLLLEPLEDDAEQLIRGLLWAHRPDVAWWNDQPYPGGNW